ncbi:hypothetical protein M011DRAFT_379280, partial [Sporormia fimetaria CBS 119925]
TPTTTLTAHCHCDRTRLSFIVLTSSLPIPVHFCHCTICRRTHGTLASIHARLKLGPTTGVAVDLTTLTAYRSSENVTRYFCSTCGAQLYDHSKNDAGEENYYFAVSLIDAPESTWDFKRHIHVGSTRDGGLASWLPRIGDLDITTFQPPPTLTSQSRGPDAKLHARCHCNGISFLILPPSSPAVFFTTDPTVTPTDKSKWYALNDVCHSCRLVSGCAIVSWMFPLASHLRLENGLAWPADHVFGTARKHRSSEGVERTFCGTCGATVAYVCEERGGMVDVAVGLVDEVDWDKGEEGRGGRLEGWLEWRRDGLGFKEDAV